MMYLGPLFLMEWTALSIFGSSGLFYAIFFISIVADP